jgi:acetylornithine/succinyldiaminopimelate/putrescine aminotransferase
MDSEMEDMMETSKSSQSAIAQLHAIREQSGTRRTLGIDDATIARFCEKDPTLVRAIHEAGTAYAALQTEFSAELKLAEADLIPMVQAPYVNFYLPETVNPYVTLTARGPWIITTHGAVVHDSGGYGMLGFGHGPDEIMAAMSQNAVMANVMSANFSQMRLAQRLNKEIGHTRGGNPYSRFICMNSGSEAVTVASRIADVQAKNLTAAGARYDGRTPVLMSLSGSFHGRTDRPAQVSDSCLGNYRKNLHSFANRANLLTAEPNNVADLEAVFSKAEADNLFVEVLFIEPVMGEGNPGECVQRDFYDAARRLTKAHGTLLVVDSIQAGIRGTGCLSIVDYPGFQDAEEPDMETYSKALNAGQYPLSVLALNTKAAELYVSGIYGNTMTTNPRALEVACTVLDGLNPAIRKNIVARGKEFVTKLEALGEELGDGVVLKVQGTGLLLAAELDPARFPVVGFDGVEERCRIKGFGVIHGGKNALRLTPHFNITSDEIDMIVDIIREVLVDYAQA